jgi:ligand-binding sensor domain-containing protein
LRRYRPELDEWEEVDIADEAREAAAITQDSSGALWAGGDNWVARSGDGGATWTLIGTAEGGLGSGINSLAEDAAGRVWVGAHGDGVSVWENGSWRHLQH